MRKTNKAFTLAELLITTAIIAMIMGSLAYIFQVTVGGWSTQGVRMGLAVSADRSVKAVAKELRNARVLVNSYSGELRFTTDNTTYYVYYLYNLSDSYPPQFNKGLYQLKKTLLSGGINGTFTYGNGDLIMRDILPPPSSTISYAGGLVIIDLNVQRKASTMHFATKIRPRNI